MVMEVVEGTMTAIPWKKILCPVDFTDDSRPAVRVACDLAARFGAELVLFHADSKERVAQAAQRGDLATWKRDAEALGAARVGTASQAGDPGVLIPELAASGGFDLVVMATHGRIGRGHMLAGSVTEEAVRCCLVPVLTVHADWAPRAG